MMTVEIKIIENPLSDWKLGDLLFNMHRMFSVGSGICCCRLRG